MSGLLALLDDVAAIAKMAAAQVDDIAAHATKAASKSAGVVVDDAAVTPKYVTGIAAARELPMIGKIAAGSLSLRALGYPATSHSWWLLPLFRRRRENLALDLRSSRHEARDDTDRRRGPS
jgi:uncharacterized protein